jgi:hypothetical protein
MSQSLNIIIVEKPGTLKPLSIKEFNIEDLYKKCGFKKGDDFIKQCEWNSKVNGIKYFVEVFAKIDGRPNSENKYDFPPPIDTTLFYGNCAILLYTKSDTNDKKYIDLSLSLWNIIYEKLFGGFEDLSATAKEDEEEEDELDNIPNEFKTKQGYLKDGFVVDSSEEDEDEDDVEDVEDEENEDLKSELSIESYEYD